jgi:topoisomerase-4 subunit B
MADPDGDAIFNEIVYLFSKFARFLLDHHMVYRAMSPLFRGISKTTGQLTYYYPDDMFDSFGMPIDLDTKHHFDRWKGLGSLTPETGEVYDSFYNPLTRRLVLVTPDGIDYSRGLNENIENRKKLLFDKGILSNPYNFTDL